MDIQTQDGIMLRGIPDGTPDEAIKVRLAQIRGQAQGSPPAPAPSAPIPQMNQLQARMGIRGQRAGQGTDTLLPNIGNAIGSAGYDVGGAATDLSARLGASPEIAGGIGVGANIATEALPAAAGGIMGAAAKVPSAMQNAGRWLMGNALKSPLEAIQSGAAKRAVETMLKEGAGLTESSVNAMRTASGTIENEVRAALASAPETVKGTDVGKRLMETYQRFKLQANPQEDLAAITKAWEQFKAHPDLAGRFQNIPVALANQLKQGTTRALVTKAYGELQGASTEAQKTLARGLRETVAEAVPEVAPKLARQSDIINATELQARRVAMLSKIDPISFGWIATHPLGAMGYVLEKNAPLKAALARLLYSPPKESIGRAAGAVPGGISGQEP